jgi:Ca2+/Na+ antiporter
MADYQVLSELHDLVSEFGRDMITQQARMSQNVVDMTPPSQENPQTKPANKRMERPISVKRKAVQVGTVQVKNGGIGSMGTTADAGTRRASSAVKLFKGTYNGVIVEGTIEFPQQSVRTARGGDGIDLFEEQVKTFGSQYGVYLARSILGSQVDNPTSNVLAAATSFTVDDPSGYIIGEVYDQYNTGGTFIQSWRVSNIEIAFDLTATITLSEALVSGITAASDAIYLSGQGSSATRMQNLKNVSDSATLMYGLAVANFPSGLAVSTVAAWGNSDGRRMMDVIAVQSGSRPTHIIANSVGASKIVNSAQAQIRFVPGTSSELDAYGGYNVPMFNGVPVIVDEQQGSTTFDFINADACFLHEFYPFGPDIDGGGQGEMGRSSLQLSREKYSYELRCSSAQEFVVNHRRAFGRFTGVGD